jgi:hypothetical protein
MPLSDILKRHAKQFISGTPRSQRDMPSLEDELREEFRTAQERTVRQTLDPGYEEREAAERAAELEGIRSQPGTGRMVALEGHSGSWEAIELIVGEPDTATFSLVDRQTGAEGQLGATDDGSVVLDLPNDQFSTRIAGAFRHSSGEVGIRLDGAELRSDRRSIRVTCDLRANL